MMTSANSTFDSAVDAYKALDFRYAAMRFRQAAELAREFGDEVLWFESTVWWAESLYALDDYRQAFGLILDARAEEPLGGGHAHWLCRKLQFKVRLEWDPIRGDLEALLSDLERYGPVEGAAHDLHVLRGEMLRARGRWAEAVKEFELASIAFEKADAGATKFHFAWMAVECCLALRLYMAAEDWRHAIYDKREWDGGFEKAIRIFQASARLTISRVQEANYQVLRPLLRELEDLCHGTETAFVRDELRRARMRVHLLSPDGGDPASAAHTSRRTCCEFPSRQSCYSRFNQSLLVLDYRLACLRFAVGVAAIDDEFHAGGPLIDRLTPAKQMSFERRLLQAAAALRRAEIRAANLDTMLCCDWRSREVERRAGWIRAIALAVASEGLHSSPNALIAGLFAMERPANGDGVSRPWHRPKDRAG